MQKVFVVFLLIKYIVAETAIIESNVLNNENKELVSHGELFDIQEYPFMVYFKYEMSSGDIGMCTGSLILPLFVLTAAHCTNKVDRWDIVVYRYKNTWIKLKRYVKRIYQHESYDHYTGQNDISLLRIEYPFNDVSHYINVSGHPNEFSNAKSLKCIGIGYGQTEKSMHCDHFGYMTNLNIMYGHEECLFHLLPKSYRIQVNNTFGKKCTQYSLLNGEFSSKTILCSQPSIHNLCPGDSGGPLICNGYLYGLASFVYNVNPLGELNCGNPQLQSGYLFVYFYRDWISNTILNAGNLIKLCDKLFNISVILILYNFS